MSTVVFEMLPLLHATCNYTVLRYVVNLRGCLQTGYYKDAYPKKTVLNIERGIAILALSSLLCEYL